MSEKPTMSDDPLHPGAPADATANPVEDATDAVQPGLDHVPHRVDLHEQLPVAHLSQAASGYGHDDPASQAGAIRLDLHDPALEHADQASLDQPIWGQPEPPVSPVEATASAETTAAPWSQLPPVLAHLAQVGLTSADQWEEQIQPRLQQLNEDIAQVHAQLDVLERQTPKK